MDTKTCTGCAQDKPLVDFYTNKSRPDGRHGRCKKCHYLSTSKWKRNNREVVNRHAAVARAMDPERARAISNKSQAKAYALNPEKKKALSREWYAENSERAATAHRAWCQENAEQQKRWFSDYYQKNAERLKARARELGPEWARNNRGKVCARGKRYYARKRHAMPVWADIKAIDGLYDSSVEKSIETGIEHHVDHVVPLQGKTVCGLHVHYNLQVLPGKENQSKGSRFWPDMP